MKKHRYISVIVMAIVLIPLVAQAALFSQTSSSVNKTSPFGGKVLTTAGDTSAVIVCAALHGPFSIIPYNIAVPGPYFIQPSSSGITAAPKKNGYILGLYNTIPNTNTCYNPESGIPIPAFNVKLYGVSS